MRVVDVYVVPCNSKKIYRCVESKRHRKNGHTLVIVHVGMRDVTQQSNDAPTYALFIADTVSLTHASDC